MSTFTRAASATIAGLFAIAAPGASPTLAAPLTLDPNSEASQKILVIPVVDQDYTYDANNRVIPTELEEAWQTIADSYANTLGTESAESYWNEVSYGKLQLNAELANCFYQVQQSFPTADEDDFVPAEVVGTEDFIWAEEFSFDNLTLEYLVNPVTDTPATVTLFTSEPINFDVLEAGLNDLLSDFGVDAYLEAEVRRSVAFDAVVFKIEEDLMVEGSYVRVVRESSSIESLTRLGFNQISYSVPTPGTVHVNGDGLKSNGQFRSPDRPTFHFYLGEAEVLTSAWNVSCPTADTCPTWSSAAELIPYITPSGGSSANEVVVDASSGRDELQFRINFDPMISFDRVEVTGTQDSYLRSLGLLSLKETVANGRKNINRNSITLATQALQHLLSVELTAPDAGCLSAELTNQNLPDPASPTYADEVQALRDALNVYLQDYKSVHVALLSQSDTIRDNAADQRTLNMTLSQEISPGNTITMPYDIEAGVAAVEASSGASTIAHEIGHNLGFPDLYDNSNDESELPSEYHPDLAFPGQYDLMANHTSMFHPSLFTKQLNQWVTGWGGATVGQMTRGTTKTYIVTPLERSAAEYEAALTVDYAGLGIPTDAEIVKGVVLPLANPGPAGTVADHYLAIGNRSNGAQYGSTSATLYIADNISNLNVNGADIRPISRNYSHRLAAQSFDEMSSFELNGADWFPGYEGLIVRQVNGVPGPPGMGPSIVIEVVFPNPPFVDLEIKPWDPNQGYATYSIWFEPGSPTPPPIPAAVPADIGNKTVPLYAQAGYMPTAETGPLNWVMVAVDNNGNVDAEDVKLKLTTHSPGAMGSVADWIPILYEDGEIPYDAGLTVAQGTRQFFRIPWSPTVQQIGDDQHTCLAAEVYEWMANGIQNLEDVVPYNNTAQENIHQMTQVSRSPWREVPFEFTVYNNYNRAVDVAVVPEGLPEGYLVELEATDFEMAGKTTRTLTGTFRWDENVIPTPPNQDPNDPYWQACSEGGTSCETVYEAETMNHPVGGPTEGGWNVWSDGYIYTEPHSFPPGESTITVRAKGQPADGEWPLMEVWVSELFLGEVVVSSSAWKDYEFPINAGYGGNAPILVMFTNDYYVPPADRNLLVDHVRVDCGESETPEDSPRHCGSIWNLTAYAMIGDFRVPLGGISFDARAMPEPDITTNVDVNQTTGDVTVTGSVEPPVADQPIRVHVGYPGGDQEIITTTTDGGGTFTVPFTPDHRGPVTVTVEVPPGGPFAPTVDDIVPIDACVPAP